MKILRHIILLFFVMHGTMLSAQAVQLRSATAASTVGYKPQPELKVTAKQNARDKRTAKEVGVQIVNGDTLYLVWMRELYVYPPMKFKSKKQERFYWRTVRDVKKTLPYAKVLAKEMERTNEIMSKMDNRQKKKFWKQYEKLLMQQYEVDLRSWTAGQGQMLMKLIDRETGITSYEVIKLYKGTFVANFWQGIAKMVGNDLKADYDGNDKDQIVERIITLVEAGQL